MSHDVLLPDDQPRQHPLRCAVYVPVSVDDRLDSKMPSVEVQGQAYLAYIEAHRHQSWQAKESIYEDSGYSEG